MVHLLKSVGFFFKVRFGSNSYLKSHLNYFWFAMILKLTSFTVLVLFTAVFFTV